METIVQYFDSLGLDFWYLLKIGGETDCALKLRMAFKTMTSDQFDDLLPAHIDLTEVGRAVIRPDASLEFGS